MKKTLAILCCLVVAAVGIALTGCGDKYADSPYVGTWKGTTAEYNGLQLQVEQLLGEFTIKNDADGTCTVTVGGNESTGSWEPSANGFIVDSAEDMEFVEQNGGLALDYQGVVLRFEKE